MSDNRDESGRFTSHRTIAGVPDIVGPDGIDRRPRPVGTAEDPFGIGALDAKHGRRLSYRPPVEAYRAADGFLRSLADNTLWNGVLPENVDLGEGPRKLRGNPPAFDGNPKHVGRRFQLEPLPGEPVVEEPEPLDEEEDEE